MEMKVRSMIRESVGTYLKNDVNMAYKICEEDDKVDVLYKSLFEKIKGDAFAPRNDYSLKIDFLKEPPIFKVSETHWAKTWLLDPRAPKVEPPKVVSELHERMLEMTKKGGVYGER